MKHSVGLFSVLVLMLLAVVFVHPTVLAQTPTLSPSATADTQQSEAYIAAVSPDGSMVASIITNIIHLRIWDTASGNVLFEMEGFPPPYALAWSPDSKRIATSGGDGFIRVWCADRSNSPECTPNSLIHALPAGGILLGIDWHKNGLLASTTQGSGTGVGIWDMNDDYRLVDSIPLYDFYQIAWQPDGSRLVLATSNGLITLSSNLSIDPNVDFVTDQRLGPIVDTTSVAWSTDGKTIAAGTHQGAINLFDWETKTQIAVLIGHSSSVNALAWNPDNVRLASADGNGIIRIWNTLDNSFQTISTNRTASQISWSLDGSTLYYPLDAVEKPAGVPPDPLRIGSETQTLRGVFNAPTCQRACWLGIEPGVTTQDEVRTILSDLGIAYEAKDELGRGAPKQDNPFGWLPDDDLAFIDNANGESEVRLYFWQGLVHSIRIPVHITLALILEAYGAPIQVRHLGENAFELVYPALGMNFYFNSRASREFAVMLTLFSETGALQNVEPFDSPFLLQDCTFFSTPCTIATATPMAQESDLP